MCFLVGIAVCCLGSSARGSALSEAVALVGGVVLFVVGAFFRYRVDLVDNLLERFRWPTFERGSREVKTFLVGIAVIGALWVLYGVFHL